MCPDSGPGTFRERASFVLAREPQAIGEARHRIAKFVRGRLRRAALGRLELLTSEIVTNAVRHGDGDLELVVTIFDDRVRVEVHDAGPGFVPEALEAPPGATGGFGLYLVAALSERWGVATGPRTRVWFEVAAAWPQAPGTTNRTSTSQPAA